jgi:peptide/nickel transport system substrate-binding protein
MTGYWNKVLENRISRRRALVATGGTAAAALFIAACGGSDSGDGEDASGQLTSIRDETKSAIKGGILKNISTTRTLGFDPHAGASGISVEPTYSTLWIQQAGFLRRPFGEILGDLADSWEYSPDRLTLTVKLSPKAHFSPQEPTKGRLVDAQDVVFSWERVLRISAQAGNLANSKNPNAPIESISAIDDKTVRIKLAKPDATVQSLLSSNFQGYLNVAPKEGADPKVLDISNTVRGSGPWYMESVDDLHRGFKRNPGFGQDKRDIPYLDGFQDLIIPEYPAALAQFRTGAGHTFPQILAEDVIPIKNDVPEIEIRQADFRSPVARPFFGQTTGSPFVDQRVRQAFVRTWDRDLFTDIFFNVSNFEQAGLAVDTLWETAIQSTNWDGWVIDARSKDFGSNGRLLNQDIEDAKKLLSAAGHTNGVTFTAHSPTNLGSQSAFDRVVDVILGMAEDSGVFKVGQRKQAPWVPTWVSEYHQQKANAHEGVAFTQSGLVFDPVNEAALWYHPSSGSSKAADSVVVSLIDRAKAEFDDDKRRELIRDLQRHEAEMAFFPRIAGATGFTVTWPAVRNVNVWQSGTPSRPHATIFIDPSKPPITRG